MRETNTGRAISDERRGRAERRRLRLLSKRAKKAGDLATWRRAKAVLGYLSGRRVVTMARELDVTRGSINRWLQWFDAEGAEGLKPRKAAGRDPQLTEAQRSELTTLIEAGPQGSGYSSGVWTGPMIGDLIRKRYGVSYHNHSVPRLLHQLGFSVQRPRKRLARADHERQAYWLKERFPMIKKKPQPVVA